MTVVLGGDFYEDDEPIEKIRAIVALPPNVTVTFGAHDDADIVVHLDEVADEVRARLHGRAAREGKSVAQVVTDLIARHV